jgi:hypothetical protein
MNTTVAILACISAAWCAYVAWNAANRMARIEDRVLDQLGAIEEMTGAEYDD